MVNAFGWYIGVCLSAQACKYRAKNLQGENIRQVGTENVFRLLAGRMVSDSNGRRVVPAPSAVSKTVPFDLSGNHPRCIKVVGIEKNPVI